jgi:hypothetical protein
MISDSRFVRRKIRDDDYPNDVEAHSDRTTEGKWVGLVNGGLEFLVVYSMVRRVGQWHFIPTVYAATLVISFLNFPPQPHTMVPVHPSILKDNPP